MLIWAAALYALTIVVLDVAIDSRWPELRSPYLDGDELEVRAWAHDALSLALPAQIVCREDCLGLCATCGANLNEASADHAHEQAPDPRFAKLSELRFE